MRLVATVGMRDPSTDTTDGVPVVSIDEQSMRQADLIDGDAVTVDPFHGRSIAAKAVTDHGAAGGEVPTVRLNRVLRRATRTRPGHTVEILKLPLAETSELTVRPGLRMPVSRELEEHVEQWLRAESAVVSAGTALAIPMPGSRAVLAATVERVVPEHSSVGPNTRVFLEASGGHGGHGGHGDDGVVWNDVLYDDVGGLAQIIDVLREAVQLPLERPDLFRQLGVEPSRGVLLHGPPGTGKTRLIRALAGEVNATVHLLSGPAFVGTGYGETEKNIRKLFEEAARTAPSVILLDELDSVAPNRAHVGSQGDSRAVAQLLAALDGLVAAEGVAVVATTNRLGAVDPAFRRPGRFDKEIYVGPPSEAGRLEILKIHTREMNLAADTRSYLPQVAKTTHGFVGADLMQLCREAALHALREHLSSTSSDGVAAVHAQTAGVAPTVSAGDFDIAMGAVQPSSMRHVRIIRPGISLDDLIGLDDVKRRLRRFVERSLFAGHGPNGTGRSWAPGIVLAGPPGSGKTHLAHGLAREWDVNVVSVSGPEVFSKWLGESEQMVRDLFRSARSLAPAIVFLDQLDGIVALRGEGDGGGATRRVVNQLQSELDALRQDDGVIVVAATNRPDLVDPSVMRRGRLGTILHVGPLGPDDRMMLMKSLLNDNNTVVSDSNVDTQLIELTEGWVGNDVISLCEELNDDVADRAERGERLPIHITYEGVLKCSAYIRSS